MFVKFVLSRYVLVDYYYVFIKSITIYTLINSFHFLFIADISFKKIKRLNFTYVRRSLR